MSSVVSDGSARDVQKIVVTLSEPDLAVEPGSVARLLVTMTNSQAAPDRLLLEVEGVDVEWYAIPVSAVNVGPGETVEERINFRVSASSENRAGSYPFLVRVKAMETGETGVAQAMLTLKRFDSLQLDLNPKRVAATFLRPLNDLEIILTNGGNAETTLELFADDTDDGCAFEFDQDRLTLKPGQSESLLMAARPRASSILGGLRLYSFKVTARSVSNAYVSATAHGQIEKRALISPLLGIFLLLLGMSGAGYVLFRPIPPVPGKIEAFNATQTHVRDGQEVTLTWKVTGDKPQITLKHRVGKDGVAVFDNATLGTVGSLPVKPEGPQTEYTLDVRGADGNNLHQDITVVVDPAPPAPKPALKTFAADNTVIHVGEPVVLSWQAQNAKAFLLDPGGQQFSRFVSSTTVTPQQDITYSLKALGEDDKMAPAVKSVQVHVVSQDTSIAEVDRFVSTPAQVFIGDRVKLKWHTRHARTVTLETDRGDQIGERLTLAGSTEVIVSAKTKFTLKAFDSLSKVTFKEITIDPQPRPLPPPVNPTGTEPPLTQPDGTPTTPPQDGTNPPNPAGTGGQR